MLNQATSDDRRSPWASFWQTLVRFQPKKMTPWLALRNSLGVFLPLVVGLVSGQFSSGIIMASGALNVAFSDSHEPYVQRVRRMLAASALVGLAVFAGETSGHWVAVAVISAGAWAFAAGMLVSLSSTAADLGAMSLVTSVVYAAVPQPLDRAFYSGLLAVAGGLLQTGLAVLLWPVRRYAPERRALAELYLELAPAASSRSPAFVAPPASGQISTARQALASLRDYSPESERYRLLLSQAERMRLALLTMSRLRFRLARDHGERPERDLLKRYGDLAAGMLESIGTALEAGRPAVMETESLRELQVLSDGLRGAAKTGPPTLAALLRDARFQMDALTGQLRSALELAAYATPEGIKAYAQREVLQPWYLRLQGTLATLGANLSVSSAACRHAVRLAVCVALGDALGRGFGVGRPYWLTMTIVIVLKPDFTATFSRGVLRLAGTLAGLAVATGLFHVLPGTTWAQVVMVALLMFVLRWVGPTNYGVLVMAVTALVVFLVGLTGVSPHEVIVARAVNTLAGGTIALVAYALWPTWEHTQAPDAVARMLDAYRDYFRAVRESYVTPSRSFSAQLDSTRMNARLARSNVEASIDRLVAEPRTTPEMVSILDGLMAASHRLVHAVMALEAGLTSSRPVPARAPFIPFANAVEVTLYSLAAALRGSPLRKNELPDLREAHYALVHSGDSITERYAHVNVETDRITNSLNTLSEAVLAWRARERAAQQR